jgi:hypothetical protein
MGITTILVQATGMEYTQLADKKNVKYGKVHRNLAGNTYDL